MNPPKKHQNRVTGNRKAESGAALIIVLASLIFISALSVAFLVSMRSKLAISKSGSDSSEVKMLAETAVNIAISQVRDATKMSGQNSLAWASQPGMIRLYNSAGSAAGYYKLYSADTMVATSGAFNSGTNAPSDLIPAAWASSPAIFTDLNAPAFVRDPLDPTKTIPIFPIVDSAAATALGVQGFSLVGTVPGATTSQPSPMPVKWLYVLEDGSLHTADPALSSGTKAIIPAATAQNPIVGRIAFWTDDETCKVNVNTASEGTFWATPRFNTTGDRQLAASQPARGEYQRYPGHPATVSLKSVFPSLTSEQVFDIAPRLSWGGSQGGTVPVETVTTWITTDNDRLYASVDEVLFKIPASITRDQQGGLSRSNVEASRFFLTASSRAPELNLFGLPRIATWPIHAVNDTNYRTANDRLLAFCSTLGTAWPAALPPTTQPITTYPFYFTRQKNLEPTFDITLARNTTLLDYLDRLTAKQIPGFGGSFQSASKYGQLETRQILTEIFDYIRCTNLFDGTTPQTGTGSWATWPYAFGLSSSTGGRPDHSGGVSLGTAVPAYRADWGTRGFGGRFLQVRSAHIHFVGLGDATTAIDPLQTGTRDSSIVAGLSPANTTAVQAYIYLSTLNPSEGTEHWSPGHYIEIEGLDKFGIKLKPTDPKYTLLQFPAKSEMTIMGNMMGGGGTSMFLGGGGVIGGRVVSIDPFGFTRNTAAKTMSTAVPAFLPGYFPFFSAILPVDSTSSTMAFQGGTITIRIYAAKQYPGGSTSFHGALIEELSLTFPDASFPTPLLAANRLVGSGNNTLTNERWNSTSKYFENANDVLKTVPLDEGDIRLLVGPTPTASFFKAQADYSDSTKRFVPGVSCCVPYNTSSGGRLVQNAIYQCNGACPLIPDHINGAFTSTDALGDWDNGTAVGGDGPFINAADPGSVQPEASTGALAYYDNSFTVASGNTNFFSPNRQLPGPGMFGSLSTGVQRRLPWQTLLFRPGPPNHPGAISPPDHLLLDLFWMPVVEPYAISEPFSTAGKINMNQQLVPFTYIDRMVGLRAAMAAEQVAMIPKTAALSYKCNGLTNSRSALNLSETDGTLRQFKEKFDSGEIFRSATEICNIYLVPVGKSWNTDSAAQTDWYGDNFALVGDNTRERPYADIYNKVTTKSNTFTVHYHAQVLQRPKARGVSAPTIFDTSAGDKVVAEQRGETTFERYLDPADPRIVATDPASALVTSLEEFYRARIVKTSVFAP